MTKPTRPEVLPTESSILAARDWRGRDGEPCDHPGCLSHVSHPCEGCGRIGGYKPLPRDWLYTAEHIARISSDISTLGIRIQYALAQAQHENRVRGECLEIAVEVLKWYDFGLDRCRAKRALRQIRQRLAQLEPGAEEETG